MALEGFDSTSSSAGLLVTLSALFHDVTYAASVQLALSALTNYAQNHTDRRCRVLGKFNCHHVRHWNGKNPRNMPPRMSLSGRTIPRPSVRPSVLSKPPTDSPTREYAEVMDSYQNLFCRICFSYDCNIHGNLPKPNLDIQAELAVEKEKNGDWNE
eukprot:scaffold152868_cov24-Attheya_sp.AAC.1